jgi:hypothetical protein
MNRKKITILSLFIATLFLGLFPFSQAEAAWLTGWSYRKAITVDNIETASALTNYQVSLDTTNAIYNESGLVGSWHLSEGTGILATDSSGENNNGTLVNSPTWTTGKYGGGLSFNGTNQTVSIPHSSSIKPTSQITISAWVKPTNITTNTYYEIYRKEETDRHLLAFQGNGTILGFGITTGSVYAELDVSITAGDYTDGNWHHIVATYDGSVKKIYSDGVLIGSANASGAIGATGTATAYIGSLGNSSEFFNGLIDEVRLYNRALSNSEVSDHYNAKAKLDYSDVRFTTSNGATLVDYWQESDKKTWIEIPSISASTQETIYMYYGKSDATAVSSGTNTFLLFDNFDTFDTGKWSYINGTPTASNSILSMPSNVQIYSKTTFGVNTAITWRASMSSSLYGVIGFGDTNNYLEAFYANYTTGAAHNACNRNPSSTYASMGAQTGYKKLTVKRNSTTDARFTIDNGTETILSGTLYTAALSAYIWGQSQAITADWVFVRNYTVVEPTTSIYSEQNNFTFSKRKAVTIDNTENSSTLYDYQVSVDLTNAIYNNSGLVGSWHFNEGVGTAAADSSGENNNGTLVNGPTWTTGKYGNGLSFNGTSQYISVPTDSNLNLGTKDFAISLWFNAPDQTVAYPALISTQGGWNAGAFGIRYDNTGQASKVSVHWNPLGDPLISSTNTFSNNNWHNVVLIRNGTSLVLYVDNTLQGTATANYALDLAYGGTMRMGWGTWDGANGYFKGTLDEVRIYNRSLSPTEISDHYNATKAKLDYSDLRFTDDSTSYTNDDWSYNYSYWLESDKKAWVKIPSIAGSTQKTIYMYYGNSSATVVSNANNTLLLYDDFNDNSLDSSKWVQYSPGTATVTEANGILTLNNGGGGINRPYLKSANEIFEDDVLVEFKARKESTGGQIMCQIHWDGLAVGGYSTPNNSFMLYESGNTSFNIYSYINGTGSQLATTATAVGTTWHDYVFSYENTHLEASMDTTTISVTNTTSFSNRYIGFAPRENTPTEIDDVRVRKYTSVEPTTSIYSEQSNNTFNKRRAVTINNTENSSTLYDYQVSVDLTNAIYNESGLVGSWHFSEGGGTAVADSSGENNNGTLINDPTWTTGKYGNGLDFDGSNDYVDTTLNPSTDLGQDFTIEAWIRPSTEGNYKGVAGAHVGTFQGVVFMQYVNGWNCGYGTGSAWAPDVDVSLTMGSWAHIVAVYNLGGETKSLSLYKDGELIQTQVQTAGISHYSSFWIGRAYDAAGRYFDGLIDEVRVYNRVLSPTEISDHYNATKTKLDYSDLRFTDDSTSYTATNWNHSYSYWLESDKKAWVKIPSITGSTQKTIYMYYGNSSATAVSNGNNTFEFFDDFSDGNIDDWTQQSGTGASVYSGSLKVNPTIAWAETYKTIPTINTASGDRIIELSANVSSTNTQGIGVTVETTGGTYSPSFTYGFKDPTYFGYYDTAWRSMEVNTAYSTNTWYKLKMVTHMGVSNSSYDYYVYGKDSNLIAQKIGAAQRGTVTSLSAISFAMNVSALSYYDNVFVRKYTATEPTTSIYGEQNDLIFDDRKIITIDNTGNASNLYDYQIPVDLTTVVSEISDGSGLVSVWHLNETTGTTASDSSGNSHNGTLVNTPTWTDGVYQNALNFSNGKYVDVSHNDALNITGDLTIGMWVKPNSVSCSGADPAYALLSKRTTNSSTPYEFMIACGGQPRFQYWGTNISWPTFTSTGTLTTGAWQYVVVTRSFSGITATVTFYIDGVEAGSSSQNAGPALTSSQSVWISKDGYHTAYTNEGSYSGLIDEIRLYNRALSSAEVADHYSAKNSLDTNDARIRFTDTETSYNDQDWDYSYSYWLESDDKAWVKIPSITSSASKTIYMYYGNNNATSTSNISNTFIFGDDFTGTLVDTGKWTITDSTGWSVVNNELKGTNTTGVLTSINTFSDGVIQEVKSRYITIPANGFQSAGFFLTTSNNIGYLQHPSIDYYRNNAGWVAMAATAPSATNLLSKITIKSSSAVDLSVINYGTEASYQNVSNIVNTVSSEPIVLGKRYDGVSGGQTYEGYWDWLRIRKYTSTEPIVAWYALQSDCGFRYYNGTAIISIACEPAGPSTSGLRISKGGSTYSLILVDVIDGLASGIRIKVGAVIQALKKYVE